MLKDAFAPVDHSDPAVLENSAEFAEIYEAMLKIDKKSDTEIDFAAIHCTLARAKKPLKASDVNLHTLKVASAIDAIMYCSGATIGGRDADQAGVKKAAINTIRSALKSNDLAKISDAMSALANLVKAKQLTAAEFEDDVATALKTVNDLGKRGKFLDYKGSRERATSYNAALAFGVAADVFALKFHEGKGKESFKDILSEAPTLLDTEEEENEGNTIEVEGDNKHSSLIATSLLLRNLLRLSNAGFEVGLSRDRVAGLTAALLEYKEHPGNAKDTAAFLWGPVAASQTKKFAPIVLTVPSLSSPLSNGELKVVVRLSDALCRPLTGPSEVSVVRGNAGQTIAAQSASLVKSGKLETVPEDKALYALKVKNVPTKDQAGFFTFEFKANSGADSLSVFRTVKTMGTLKVGVAEAWLSSTPLADEHLATGKVSAEFPGKVSGPIRATHFEYLHLRLKSPAQVNQAFAKIRSASGNKEKQMVLSYEAASEEYRLVTSFQDLSKDLKDSGDYNLNLILADPFISRPIEWSFATLSISFKKENTTSTPTPATPSKSADRDLYAQHLLAPKPEIHHKFREPEARAPPPVAMLFTGLVAAPFAILLIGLVVVGFNLKNFPRGITAIFALLFIVSLAAILGLYAWYWLGKLNMFGTLQVLMLLAVPTLFFGYRTLSYLSLNDKSAQQ